MQCVRIEVLKLVRADSPGWVECSLVDAAGTEWRFVEKVPVVLRDDVSHLAFLPRPGVLACAVTRREENDVATIETHVESINGQTVFQVLATQLLEM
ncbi:MAG TPA: hypothetical protein VGQ36_07945 [Thermoanaerobaculia bacterium]|jgi:hypothetical protein|nr:hypothetical protein [Thermoanaerobaculia bacterium]